jgi:uncharacterized protein (TIGR03067 family)
MLPTLADVSAVLNALQGRWLPVYQEIDGQMVPKAEFANNVLELTGTEFKIIKDGTVAYEGFFTISPLTRPMGIALIYRKSAKPIFLGSARPGVFQVEGDTLKWCFGALGQPAPQGLNTFPGAEAVLSISQREGSHAAAAPTVGRVSAGRSVELW